MTEKNLPEDVDFNEDDVLAATQRPLLAEGWYRFVITDADNTVFDGGDLATATTCAPLTNPNDGKSKSTPTVRHNIRLPFTNHAVQGHTVKNANGDTWMGSVFLHALDPTKYDLPPKKIDGVLTFKNEPISQEAAKDKSLEVNRATMTQLRAIYRQPEQLIDEAFYAEVVHNVGDKGTFVNIRNFSPTLPVGQTLVKPEEFKVMKAA